MHIRSYMHIYSQFTLNRFNTEVTPDNHSGIFTKVSLIRSIQHITLKQYTSQLTTNATQRTCR